MRVHLCAITLFAGMAVSLAVSAQEAGNTQEPTPPAVSDQPEAAATATDAATPQQAEEKLDEAAAHAANDDTPDAESSAAAQATRGNGKIGPAPADKAQIVFFRPSKFTGGAIGFKVREGEQELGKLRSGNYFIHLAEPGTHEYVVHSEAKDVLTMEVEEGETYFVQGTITMGVLAGRPNLSPSDEATFNGMASKLKLRE